MVITDTFAHLDATRLRVSLAPRGEIDAGNVGTLADSIRDALLSGVHELDLDLREVSFMDTAALEVLQGARDTLELMGGHLCIRNATSSVQRLLSLTAFAAGCPVPH